MVRSGRRKADAAIAHQHRGHAVARRRQDLLRPGDLRVVMGVNVDKPGGYNTTLRIYFVPSGRRDRADLRNMPSEIATSAVRAGPPVPSITVPSRITKSNDHPWATLLLSQNSKACVSARISVNLASFEELSPCPADFL